MKNNKINYWKAIIINVRINYNTLAKVNNKKHGITILKNNGKSKKRIISALKLVEDMGKMQIKQSVRIWP